MKFTRALNNNKLKKYLVPFVFIAYFATGICVYKDYGMSTDESVERVTGTYALLYSLNKTAELVHADSISEKIRKQMNPDFFLGYKDNVYGTAFQIPVLLIEVAFFGIKKEPVKGIWELRHLLTFLFFYASVICFYFIIKGLFKRRDVALIAALILILSPRFFAESFYNIKDIVFLASCIFAMFFYVRYMKDRTLKNGILLGISAAYSTGIRFLGVQFIMLAVFFVLLGFVKRRAVDRRETLSLTAALLIYLVLIVFFYPASWQAPVKFFSLLLGKMSSYPWTGYQLFMGEWMSHENLHWYFIPVWMLITIPLLYILLFFHGMMVAGKQIFDRSNMKIFSSDYLVLLSSFIMLFIPLLGVILKSSMLYNGWRQMYFLYLPFLLIASYSINYIITTVEQRRKLHFAYLCFGVYFCFTGIWMIINHPYQYTYFNAVPSNIEANYEKDYWAVSMVDGMKFVLNDSNSDKIIIKRSRGTAKHSRNMLDNESKKRIEIIPDDSLSPDQFDYYFFNGDHYAMKDYAFDNNLAEVHSIKVYNSIYSQHFKIMSIYKK